LPGQFCYIDIVLTVVKNSLRRYLWTFIPATRLARLRVFIWRNFHPDKQDLASFKRDLGNRASPAACPYKRKIIFTIKITAQQDLAYRAVSLLSGPARLPYKQALRRKGGTADNTSINKIRVCPHNAKFRLVDIVDWQIFSWKS
jgi:hypothetical protein